MIPGEVLQQVTLAWSHRKLWVMWHASQLSLSEAGELELYLLHPERETHPSSTPSSLSVHAGRVGSSRLKGVLRCETIRSEGTSVSQAGCGHVHI